MGRYAPKRIGRICLKALARRASERYTTARDMADDLRHFLAEGRDKETRRQGDKEKEPGKRLAERSTCSR